MDAHGVGFGVVAAASLYGDYNDYMIRCLRRHPRLRGTVFMRPETDMYTLERMKADGVVGIRLFFSRVPNPPDLRSPEYRLLLRRVRDLDWHVHTLVQREALPDIIAAVEGAGVKLVIDHLGKPGRALGVNCPGFKALLAAIERGRTWVKLSGGFRMATPEARARLCAGAARGRRRGAADVGQRLALRRLRGQGDLCRRPSRTCTTGCRMRRCAG